MTAKPHHGSIVLGLPLRAKQACSHWHCVHLDIGDLASYASERVQLMFSQQYLAAHMPQQMCLWLARPADGGADLYLSPAAEPFTIDLRRAYNAQTCAEPRLAGLILLEGDTSATPTSPRSRWPRRVESLSDSRCP